LGLRAINSHRLNAAEEDAEKVVVLKGRGWQPKVLALGLHAVSNLFYSATLVAEGVFPRMTDFFSTLFSRRGNVQQAMGLFIILFCLRYFFLTVFTEVTFTVGITTGRRIGTSPAPGCCCCCIRVNISVRT
jgi:hypothetical protein